MDQIVGWVVLLAIPLVLSVRRARRRSATRQTLQGSRERTISFRPTPRRP